VEVGSAYRMLGRREILNMLASGLIEFGAHSRSHAALAGLSEESSRQEIADSLADVGRLTGRPCRLFAYPHGERGGSDAGAIAILAASGPRTSVAGGSDRSDEAAALELGRYSVGPETTRSEFCVRVHLRAEKH
jgi:peptidoglycan/xylan/chitin deacetylase (PgdA/CDA1 family)